MVIEEKPGRVFVDSIDFPTSRLIGNNDGFIFIGY